MPCADSRLAPRPAPPYRLSTRLSARSLCSASGTALLGWMSQSTSRKKFFASCGRILRSARCFIRYMNSSQPDTAMPSCRFTACASKRVLCGTLMARGAPSRAMVRVLLQTTRTVVGVAVVARVPSQDVASSR
ncbi:hypothetical protein D3C81_1780500 [compost metagenome]